MADKFTGCAKVCGLFLLDCAFWVLIGWAGNSDHVESIEVKFGRFTGRKDFFFQLKAIRREWREVHNYDKDHMSLRIFSSKISFTSKGYTSNSFSVEKNKPAYFEWIPTKNMKKKTE